MKLLSVSRIWDHAPHSAFTDLIDFQGVFFCCFREADSHAGTPGIIRILRSSDSTSWTSAATLAAESIDLRDPKLSIMPDGRLLLTLGTPQPYIAFSENGADWSPAIPIDLPNEWIWRVTWHEGVGYGVSYRYSNLKDLDKPWIVTLHKTTDGKTYQAITTLDVPNYPSEATLRFTPDGAMIALIRRDGNGWIGKAVAPYTQWQWADCGTRIGGPNFLITPKGQMLASCRLTKNEGTFTAVGTITTSTYAPQLVLPSGGDTSYPGMALRDNTIYVSYYSSHEGKSAIYLARIKIKE
ncbi:MAG: hypothetical protein Q8K75_05655 [Chlamydiales bacterium]|nr:hypothetical protein [Chlamydiales bacterium]